MHILGIETSCDETSAAVVSAGGGSASGGKDRTEVLSNIVTTQVEFHKKYGGIVPEIAARKHIETINLVIQEALNKAKTDLKNIDLVAVTYGPGLVGSLLVGICAAQAIAYAQKKPLIGMNHLEGHIYANFLLPSPPEFPFVCLIVSGGHTMIVLVEDHQKYKTLGKTRDDAAGEAFDKVARFLNLGYPGGPIIDKLSKSGNPEAVNFKRPMLHDGLDFSFSGIKTEVVNFVNKIKNKGEKLPKVEDIAAGFQQAIVDVLVEKTLRAAKKYKIKTIAIAGGVAANSCLRKEIEIKLGEEKLRIIIPPFSLCTDNAGMIACGAYYKFKKIKPNLNIVPIANLKL